MLQDIRMIPRVKGVTITQHDRSEDRTLAALALWAVFCIAVPDFGFVRARVMMRFRGVVGAAKKQRRALLPP
jgi:hypothetical protein